MNFITELIKYLGTPARGKWAALLTLIGISILSSIAYERCTATFRLARLQREADLLARLQEIQMRGTNTMTPELYQIRSILLTNLTRTVQEKPLTFEFVPSKLTFSLDDIWKFFWGSLLWLLLAVFSLSKRRTKEGREQIKGLFIMAGITGVIGLFVPPIWWPWFHIFIFPWLLMIGVFIALVPFGFFIANFYAGRHKAFTNACINNLRLIDGAKCQWALETSKVPNATPTEEELAKYLANSTFPKCPSGGVYSVNNVATNPTCSEKGHCLPS